MKYFLTNDLIWPQIFVANEAINDEGSKKVNDSRQIGHLVNIHGKVPIIFHVSWTKALHVVKK